VPQRSYPLARRGTINGRPFQGPHTIKNADGTFQWQSCRAFDLNTPTGTPVLAIWDGVIGQRFGPLSNTDPRFEGQRCYVEDAPEDWECANAVPPGEGEAEPPEPRDSES
jgi:hypothetical protein